MPADDSTPTGANEGVLGDAEAVIVVEFGNAVAGELALGTWGKDTPPSLPVFFAPLPLFAEVPSPIVPAGVYEGLANKASDWLPAETELGGVERSKMRSVDVEEMSPDDVVGRDAEPYVPLTESKSGLDPGGHCSRRCDAGRGCALSSLQSSITVRRRDWGLDSLPYS